jgi:TetR/AcrR family transcriptional regulator
MKKSIDSSTEEKIMEAAKDVFTKYGLYGARMQDIADQAGINKALLHYYFRTKDKLFDKIFEGALEKYFQAIDVFGDESQPVKQRIFRYIDNIIAFLSEYPQMSLFIIKEMSINPELFKAKVGPMKKFKTSMVVALEKEMEAGKLKKFDTTIFLINVQSLCAYPFISAPLFKHTLKAHGKDWNKDFSPDKLKDSVKKFVELTFGK